MEDPVTVWYQINEQSPECVDIAQGKTIGHLKSAIQREHPELSKSGMTLYDSKHAAQELDPRTRIEDVMATTTGIDTGDSPLYVTYPEPSSAAGSTDQQQVQNKLTELQKGQKKMIQQVAELREVLCSTIDVKIATLPENDVERVRLWTKANLIAKKVDGNCLGYALEAVEQKEGQFQTHSLSLRYKLDESNSQGVVSDEGGLTDFNLEMVQRLIPADVPHAVRNVQVSKELPKLPSPVGTRFIICFSGKAPGHGKQPELHYHVWRSNKFIRANGEEVSAWCEKWEGRAAACVKSDVLKSVQEHGAFSSDADSCSDPPEKITYTLVGYLTVAATLSVTPAGIKKFLVHVDARNATADSTSDSTSNHLL